MRLAFICFFARGESPTRRVCSVGDANDGPHAIGECMHMQISILPLRIALICYVHAADSLSLVYPAHACVEFLICRHLLPHAKSIFPPR
jgi:hypothetical protein